MGEKILKVMALIPARGGSKGVPHKNIKLLAGKPLLEYTFICARQSNVFDRIILSTEDSNIAAVARKLGLEVPFLRPAKFAADESPMIDVVLHALDTLDKAEGYRPDLIALLQPTSPLRKPEHIRRAIELLKDNDSVCSVVALPKNICPHFVMRIKDNGYLDFFLPDGGRYRRRQDVPVAYKRDGTIYLTRPEVLFKYKNLYGDKCVPMLMDPEESLSIDTMDDWKVAEEKIQMISGDYCR